MVRMDKQRLIIVVLIVVLLFALSYIVFDFVRTRQEVQNSNFFQIGAQQGYEQAIIEIVQLAVTCQQVPLLINNQTINIVAVECLKNTQEKIT